MTYNIWPGIAQYLCTATLLAVTQVLTAWPASAVHAILPSGKMVMKGPGDLPIVESCPSVVASSYHASSYC